MNIIALLESISLDKSEINSLTKTDFTRIKKQLVAQKELNPEIEDADITKLLKALKTNPESFQAVLNNRILFNFFANKEYPRSHFTNELSIVEIEKVRLFIQQFLGEELNSFFIKNLETNTFERISVLAEAQKYFPDHLNFSIKQYTLDKLDDAISILKPPYGNFSKVLYIKDRHFFIFINQIKDLEIEQKVKDLFETISTIYNQDSNSELANKTFLAMNSFVAFDDDFTQKIRKNKDIADTKFEAYIPKKKNLTWVYVVVGLFIFIRIVVFFNTHDFNSYSNDEVTYEDETEYKPEPRKIDRYYTNMKYAIDSFQIFLTSYKETDIKQLKQNSSIKTGDNPFETFYQNPPSGDSNNYITVTNNTIYDMVLLENAVLYDSIKMPKSAHFIKAGDNLEINFTSSYTETIFNLYVGKKWGTFQTATNKNLFIRNHSIVEYRFSELIPSAEEILETDYRFLNDAVIMYSNGNLKIDSQGILVNPLERFKE
jgi:hypothetical protein